MNPFDLIVARAGARALRKDPALRALRDAYEREVEALADVEAELVHRGLRVDEIAEILFARRNRLRWEFRRKLPIQLVVALSSSDMLRYQNPNGPQLGWLLERKDWAEICRSATSPGGKDLGL